MKIAVLVSGGVDSSVALALLKAQGHDVTAFYLKIWLEDELAYLGECPWQEDLAFVQAVCEQLAVPLEIMPLQREYWSQVVSYTIDQIKKGYTPNPDMLCNARVKFGAFLECIDDSFDFVATGHYAQKITTETGAQLHRSPDAIKDQTYFLAHISKKQLERALFPIGHLTKAQLREQATLLDLPTKNRKDSQGICFLGKLPFDEFVRAHLGTREGKLIELETDTVMGTHQGYWFYTIGQRQGIGLSGGPWYVARKDVNANIVYISRNYYSEDKQRDRCVIAQCNWLAVSPHAEEQLLVKLRHGKQLVLCTVTVLAADRFALQLAERDQGIAPGQFAVLYRDAQCIGSGVIQAE
ncbi:MAG: tRNA 2-thiouridine(34) synthase MnmA [Candidatus Babeliales bacterium]